MSSRLFFWSLTSALAGFLFGFDTVVISGAEKTIQNLWKLSDLIHGLAMSSALWGTVLGSVIGGIPTDRMGRRRTLIWIGLLYLVSAIWSGMATNVWAFMIARFLGGVGVGISTVAAPLYIAEIAPPARRGQLAGLFQFNIVFGILVAFLSNALLAGIGENAWRWMLAVEALPALIYTALCFGIPESPRWLIATAGDVAKGRQVLALINPEHSETQLHDTVRQIQASTETLAATPAGAAGSSPMEGRAGIEKRPGLLKSYQSTSLRRPIQLAFLIAFFNQLSGINAVLYFAPRIFELAGLAEKAALLQSIGIGVTNLIFTFVGLWLIDRVGRRTLLTVGSLGYIASLGLCSWAYFTEHYSIVPPCIFAFIAAHAVGQGAVIWVFISEIFPNRFRATGQSIGSFTHWIFAALLTTFFPWMVTWMSPGTVFLVFCSMMVLQLLWVRFIMPETKGIPLEQIEAQLGVVVQ